jgi:hypothetical protein
LIYPRISALFLRRTCLDRFLQFSTTTMKALLKPCGAIPSLARERPRQFHSKSSTNKSNAAVVAGIGDAGWEEQFPESGITDPGYSAANESADVFCDEARISLVMTRRR